MLTYNFHEEEYIEDGLYGPLYNNIPFSHSLEDEYLPYWIPFKEDYFIEDYNFISYETHEEIRKWLLDNIGPELIYSYQILHGVYEWRSYYDGCRFKNKNDAALFKLFWC
jgi:hypothetical protein